MLTTVPPTDCMRAREGASARLDGALDELESVWLDGHLGRCAACSAFAGQVAATAAVLRAAPLDPAPAGLFFVRGRRRVAVPVAAVAATIVIAVTAATSFFVGQQLGERSGGTPVAVTTTDTSAKRLDPGLVAMLQRGFFHVRADSRVVAI